MNLVYAVHKIFRPVSYTHLDVYKRQVLGRVASGVGGDLVISECNRVLAEEHPELDAQINVTLPDEMMRRVGQSVAAASLPATK